MRGEATKQEDSRPIFSPKTTMAVGDKYSFWLIIQPSVTGGWVRFRESRHDNIENNNLSDNIKKINLSNNIEKIIWVHNEQEDNKDNIAKVDIYMTHRICTFFTWIRQNNNIVQIKLKYEIKSLIN